MADIYLNDVILSTEHPGEMLRCELEARSMSQRDLAEAIDKATPIINDIIKGRRDINAEIAVRLEVVLDNISAETWLNWQNAYDIQRIRENEDTQNITVWNTLKTLVNINYLKKRLNLDKNIESNINRVYKFLGVESTQQLQDKISTISAYFRKSENYQTNYINLMTWIAIVRHRSESLTLENRFDPNSIQELVCHINKILYDNNDTISRIERLLSHYGIKFIVEEKLEKMPVDGYSFWEGNNPTIVMTKRLNRIDNFAFVLFHELGHIYLHLLNSDNKNHDFIETEVKVDEGCQYENEANKFAKECIWGEIDHIALFARVSNPYTAGNYLSMISSRLNINLGVVVGQYQYFCYERKLCSNAYTVCNKFMQKIN